MYANVDATLHAMMIMTGLFEAWNDDDQGDDDDDDYDVCRRSTSQDHFVVGVDSDGHFGWWLNGAIDERILITAAAYLEALEQQSEVTELICCKDAI